MALTISLFEGGLILIGSSVGIVASSSLSLQEVEVLSISVVNYEATFSQLARKTY
jgi:predicted ATP-grasp superfamily ATP-dependent carboligase